MSRPRRFATFMAIAFAFALVGALLGGAVMLIDLWRRPDLVATATAQASVANPADTSARTPR
jgi:hypothetical protein